MSRRLVNEGRLELSYSGKKKMMAGRSENGK